MHGAVSPGDETAHVLGNNDDYGKLPKRVYLLTFLSCVGGLLFGYDTGVVSGAMILIRTEFDLTDLWHELIVASTIAAAWLFSLVSGYFTERLGRKKVILGASVLFTIGAVIMGVSYSKEVLLVGRIIVGIAIGFASMTVPVYVAEATPPHIRGKMVTVYALFVTGGQFVAGIICGLFSNTYEGWRYMLALAGVPALIQLVGFLWMPESPRWLVSRGNTSEAERVLTTIRPENFPVRDEVESIMESCKENERVLRENTGDSSSVVIVRVLQTQHTRRALFVGVLLMIFQQICGINTVMYYSATIIQMSGVTDDSLAIWLSAVTAFVNFLFTFVTLYCVEKAGRRMLVLFSIIGVMLSLALLAIAFQVADTTAPSVSIYEYGQSNGDCTSYSSCTTCTGDSSCGFCYYDGGSGNYQNGSCVSAVTTAASTSDGSSFGRCYNSTTMADSGSLTWAYGYCPSPYSWLAMVGMVVYLMFFAPGMGAVPWAYNAEIYPLWARSTCNSISTSACWLGNLFMSMTFLSLMKAITSYGAFYLYSGFSLVGFFIFFLFMPETKGLTLEEMEGAFSRSCIVLGQPGATCGPCCPGGSSGRKNDPAVQYVHIRGLNRARRFSDDDDDDSS